MSPDPLAPTLGTLGWIVVDAVLMLVAVIFVVRLAGLRSFAKMSSFDFAVTVACGSILASIVLTQGTSFVHGLVALTTLLAAQVAVALARKHLPGFRNTIDNSPLLLMDGPTILEDNLAAGRITRGDLIGKLREANVLDFKDVRAVVLENTGDISVLHGDGPLDDEIMSGVRRSP